MMNVYSIQIIINEKYGQIEKLSLRKKENRYSIIVSKFLMEKCSWLKLNSQQCQENPFTLKLEFIFNWKRSGQILDEWEFSQTNKNEDYTDF